MKSWQIFTVGIAVLVAAFLFPAYERFLAGMSAVLMVAVVILGFLLKPQRDTFCLPTTVILIEPDFAGVEHDRIAIRVELVRLWLLFLPTFAAISFLVVASARGTVWDRHLLDGLTVSPSYLVIQGVRLFIAFVVGILSSWFSERWVLWDADARSADSVSTKTGGLLYSFRDQSGGYFGGEGFLFGLIRPPQLARIVFYRRSNPQMNKIAMACLFHRPVIIGRGVTDLDEATIAVHSVDVRPASQPL